MRYIFSVFNLIVAIVCMIRSGIPAEHGMLILAFWFLGLAILTAIYAQRGEQ